MQFYDVHSHILPNFDDGAENVKETLELLNCLRKQNVNNICFTPHFYTNEMSAEDFVEKRNIAYKEFLPHKPSNVNIVLGSEVYVTRFLFSNEDLSGVTYGKSNYILTEFGYSSSFSEKTMSYLYKLIEDYNMIPIIPHIERYSTLMSDLGVIIELKAMGILIQTNVNNYTKKASFLKRRKLIKLIDTEMIDLLGTDVHSMNHNSPENYTPAIECIRKYCGDHAVERMMRNAKKIFDKAMGTVE